MKAICAFIVSFFITDLSYAMPSQCTTGSFGRNRRAEPISNYEVANVLLKNCPTSLARVVRPQNSNVTFQLVFHLDKISSDGACIYYSSYKFDDDQYNHLESLRCE